MSSQSLGLSHMKLGAEPELRSLIRAQSVTEQPVGFARTRLLQRAEFDVMSWKSTKPLWMKVYGSLSLVAQPAETGWFSKYPFQVTPAASKRSTRLVAVTDPGGG